MNNNIPLSFEFFPPKTAEGIDKLRETRQQLAKFDPEFSNRIDRSLSYQSVSVDALPQLVEIELDVLAQT